jgi:hypothetical protein
MASVTLAESAKLSQDMLVQGVIENIITVDRFFEVLPFDAIEGNALGFNRENALGDVMNIGVDATITAKNPATFTYVTSSLTTILGDAEVNGLIQATRSNEGNDQTAVQVASKAKSVGRQFRNHLINGTGATDQFSGLLLLVAAGQTIIQDTAGVTTNGGPLSFAALDNLIDLVTDKDGEVDFIAMHARTLRSYLALLRGLGGALISEVVTLPSGATVPGYRGIPIFRNDWLPLNQTQGTLTTGTSVFAGTFDDGSRTHGIAGLTATNAAGIQVEDVGVMEAKDNRITRVKWYCGLACFNLNGLAMLKGVSN